MESTRPRPSTTQKTLVRIASTSALATSFNVLAVEAFDLLQQGKIVQKEKTLLALIDRLHHEKHLDSNVKNFLYACTYSLLAKRTYYDSNAKRCAELEVTEDFIACIPNYLAKASEHLSKVKCSVQDILDLYKIDRNNIATLFNLGSLVPDMLIHYIHTSGKNMNEHDITALIECFQYYIPACKDVIHALTINACELQALFMAVNRKPILFLADFLETLTSESGQLDKIDRHMLSISIELHLGRIEREALSGHLSPASRQFLNTLIKVAPALNKEDFFQPHNWCQMESIDAFQSLIQKLIAIEHPKAFARRSSVLFHPRAEPAVAPCDKTSFIRNLSNYLYASNRIWKTTVLKFITYTDMPAEIKAIKKILKPTRYRDEFVMPAPQVLEAMFEQIKPLFEEFSRPYTGRDQRHPMVDQFLNDFRAIIKAIEEPKSHRLE
jgi:hypothetical protein